MVVLRAPVVESLVDQSHRARVVARVVDVKRLTRERRLREPGGDSLLEPAAHLLSSPVQAASYVLSEEVT